MHGADAQQDAVFDARVRHEMMAQFVRRTTAPSPGDVAGALGASTARVRAAFRRLADAHVLVLRAGSEDIVMAHPLSAVPTGPTVRGTRSASRRCSARTPASRRRAATAPSHAGLPWLTAASCATRSGSTSPFPHGAGGTTSRSHEGRCCSSGTRSTWIAGRGRRVLPAASRCPSSRAGSSRASYMPIAGRSTGAARRRPSTKRCSSALD
jgi:hypothetical protein